MKRQPTLADYALAARWETPADAVLTSPRIRHWLQDKLSEAKRFVLDAEASRYVGEMIAAVPEAIAYGQEFALPPFDNCWIEYDARALWEAVNAPRLSDAEADDKVGFQIVWPSVYVWSWAERHPKQVPGQATMLPFKYKLFQPFTMDHELAFCEAVGTSRIQLDAFFWGESLVKIAKLEGQRRHGNVMLFDNEAFDAKLEANADMRYVVRSLRANHSVEMLIAEKSGPRVKQVWWRMHGGAGADLRNILAVLLFLNRTSKVQFIRDVPPQQGWIRSKPRTLTRHSVVTIKLNPLPQLKWLGHGGGAWRRLHDVRSHFCINKRARHWEAANPSHLHDWSEMRPNLWRCLGCGGLKWWRRAHQRGKKKFGHVETIYEVTE